MGFTCRAATPARVNIMHADPYGRGPFCRIRVAAGAPTAPGVYAWVVDFTVMYVGESHELVQIVHGATMDRPYNDYTYIPASQVKRPFDPRVRINGLLNLAFVEGRDVNWWWYETETPIAAKQLEARLVDEWRPPWNRARPVDS
jgi:hypothetical protein